MRIVLEPHELKYIHKVLDEFGNDIIIIIKDVNVNDDVGLIQEKEIEVKEVKDSICHTCYNADCEEWKHSGIFNNTKSCFGYKPKPEVKKDA